MLLGDILDAQGLRASDYARLRGDESVSAFDKLLTTLKTANGLDKVMVCVCLKLLDRLEEKICVNDEIKITDKERLELRVHPLRNRRTTPMAEPICTTGYC